MELVSTVIPTHNALALLPRAIESVLAQSYPHIEVIVVDDGSTDATAAEIQSRFPTVRYLRQENAGPARARNAGLRLARGEFVAFLDADDYWLPHKVERQLALFRERPALGMVFTDNFYTDEREQIRGVCSKRDLMEGDPVRNIFARSGVTTSSVMVRRAILDRVGPFEEGLITAEDDNLWMRIALRHEIALIEEPLIVYRVAEGSTSRTPGNVYKGVGRQLDLIERDPDYAQLRARLGELPAMKRASINFAEGTHALRHDDSAAAREFFRAALRHRPGNLRARLYLAATFLPVFLVEMLRRAKRAVRGPVRA